MNARVFRMVLKIEKKYESEADLCRKLLNTYNTIGEWGLTSTQIEILVYIIRFGYNSETRDIICKSVNITPESLTSCVSYMRKGRVGKRKIKKVLMTSSQNKTVTKLCQELLDIKEYVYSKDSFKALYLRFIDDSVDISSNESETDT